MYYKLYFITLYLVICCGAQNSDYTSGRNITYSHLNELIFNINKNISDTNTKGRSNVIVTNELPKKVVPSFSGEEPTSMLFWSYYNSEVSF